jgi:two-component system nitrogen regulation response regulator NtrX
MQLHEPARPLHAPAVITVLVPQGAAAALSARLHGLGCQVGAFDPKHPDGLRSESTGRVILIPESAMHGPGWARWRVELNRACRQFVVCLECADVAATVRAMREGAHDVIAATDPPQRWRDAITDAAKAQELWQQLYGAAPLTAGEVLLGRSEALQQLRQTIRKLGPTDVTVLIQGESGVGKECVAAALHQASRRPAFVSLNCAAIPRELVESELFGSEKGAFTGAVKARSGVFEQAAGGTLFLDEIGELDLAVQPKLLRVLEFRQARRVGGETSFQVTARIVAATNRNLEAEVAAGRFRLDLFYRVAEIILQAPPLRARPEDIPELALKFLAGANERFGKNFQALEPGLLQRFQTFSWPGNVRELKSTIDRLVLLFDGPVLRENWWEPPPPPAARATPDAGPAPPRPEASAADGVAPAAVRPVAGAAREARPRAAAPRRGRTARAGGRAIGDQPVHAVPLAPGGQGLTCGNPSQAGRTPARFVGG